MWLLGSAVAVVMLLFSVLVYPSLGGNQAPQSGARPATSSTSEPGLQFLGQQQSAETRTEWPSGTLPGTLVGTVPGSTSAPTSTATPILPTAGPASPPATTAAGTTSAESGNPADPAAAPPTTPVDAASSGTSTSPTQPSTTSSAPSSATTTSPSSPSSTATSDNPRAVARALFPDFGFPDNQFGCLNAAWNRLGLWSTASAVRPGLIYVKGRYGTPCEAWDHVRRTGNY